MTRELLLGAGSRRDKFIVPPGRSHTWGTLTTLDVEPAHRPDVVFDLSTIGAGGRLPFDDSMFDEIHAYEVLEHIGAQGDARTFFAQFTEFHRVLKRGGDFCATCPSYRSPWAWGDPSHTRVITAGTLAFLSQAEYRRQVGKTPMSDFRSIYKADFDVAYVREDAETLVFALKAR